MIARELYTKSFGTEATLPSTWFNFEIDTLYLDWEYEVDNYDASVSFIFVPEDIEDVEKVHHLAIYNGKYPDDVSPAGWIDHILGYFGNIESLTLVARENEDADDCGNLMFLEPPDVMQNPEYDNCSNDGYWTHDFFGTVFPKFAREYYGNAYWTDSEWLWSRKAYAAAAKSNSSRDNKSPIKWQQPRLQYKPVVSLQRKLDFLQRKSDYDRDRDAERVPVTLVAQYYSPLEVSVPLLTTIGELASRFCQARGIDLETEMFVSDNPEDLNGPDAFNIYLSLESSLYDHFGCQSTKLYLAFWHESKCSCSSATCRHVDRFWKTLWMETENWGLRDLFEKCALGA